MKAWADFYDYVLPDVPGCLPAMADIAIRQAAIAFFKDSLTWRDTLPAVPIVADVDEYDFTLADDAAVAKVLRAFVGNLPLQVLTADEGVGVEIRGTPDSLLAMDSFRFRVLPTPEAANAAGVVATVALMPMTTASGISDGLFEFYYEAIAAGALARLMLSPGKPYSNPELGGFHQRRFSDAVDTEKLRAEKAFGRNGFRVTGFYF